MDDLAMLVKLLDSMEGLTVNLKVGKESELIIKGDLVRILKVFGAITMNGDERDIARKTIVNL